MFEHNVASVVFVQVSNGFDGRCAEWPETAIDAWSDPRVDVGQIAVGARAEGRPKQDRYHDDDDSEDQESRPGAPLQDVEVQSAQHGSRDHEGEG